ncbi:MAG: hypothetical protein L6R40_005258 [Gallowayella cf. fulva]|nr:MAG: hypothetical protein L6R40_005258 [Xanthomendoza cf. fulva]
MRASSVSSTILYHLRTLYLFIASDLKTIIVPSSLFGVWNALAGHPLTADPSPSGPSIIQRFPFVLFWTALSLLPVVISNQCRPDSILEDGINKPWRNLPSRRISLSSAKRLMRITNVLSLLLNLWYGNGIIWLITVVGDWLYNEKGAANRGYLVRNLANAAAFVCYGLGATRVAAVPFHLQPVAYGWLALLGLVIASTVQTQDLPDREGDKARGRHTMPLVCGDAITRWSIIFPTLLSSAALPWIWGSSMLGYVVTVGLGLALAGRLRLWGTIEADEGSWRLWNIWVVSLYSLPLSSRVRLW